MRRALAPALFAVIASTASACPSCAGQSRGAGTLWLVLVMMGVPVIVLAVVAAVVAGHLQRARPESAPGATSRVRQANVDRGRNCAER